MTDDIIKDFVHERFRRIDEKLDKVLAASETTIARLASIENRMTSLESSVVHVHERLDGVQKQLDHTGGRLDRIERRIDLADAPSP
jgi:archaellum component FlaC